MLGWLCWCIAVGVLVFVLLFLLFFLLLLLLLVLVVVLAMLSRCVDLTLLMRKLMHERRLGDAWDRNNRRRGRVGWKYLLCLLWL